MTTRRQRKVYGEDPAFPMGKQPGLTKREYFAMMFATEIVADAKRIGISPNADMSSAMGIAVRWADDLIIALNEPEP